MDKDWTAESARTAIANMMRAQRPDASVEDAICFRVTQSIQAASMANGMCDSCLIETGKAAHAGGFIPADALDTPVDVLRARSRALAHACVDEMIDHGAKKFRLASSMCAGHKR